MTRADLRSALRIAQVVVICLPTVAGALAQNAPARTLYGGFADYNLDLQTGAFRTLPGISSCCSHFDVAVGSGVSIGVGAGIPLLRRLEGMARAEFSYADAQFVTPENTTVVGASGLVPVTFEYRLRSRLTSVAFEPTLVWRPVARLGLSIGPRVGMLLGGSYDQREVLTAPSDQGTFENHLRVRNVYSGALPDLSPVQIGLTFGLSYHVPLNRSATAFVTPEIGYRYYFTSVVSELGWHANAFRFGVGVWFAPAPAPIELPPPPAPPPVPTSPAPEPRASLNVQCYTADSAGPPILPPSLIFERQPVDDVQPLLPQVFFDEAADTLPGRYTNGARGLPSAAQLASSDAMLSHRRVLDIIGSRVRARPDAQINIIGCTDGVEPADLGRRRAETVGAYFRTAWGVEASRIAIHARELPAEPSDPSTADGRAEDRRVEIRSSEPGILSPLALRDTIDAVGRRRIVFEPHTASSGEVASWRLRVADARGATIERHGDGAPPAHIELVPSELATIPAVSQGDWRWNLEIRTAAGTALADSGSIRREIRISPGAPIERYRLLLFRFNSFEIPSSGDELVRMIRRSIDSSARIDVRGFTDRTGTDEYDRALSLARANATCEALGASHCSATGIGKKEILFDNDLPEGRLLSRTVEVLIRRP